MCILYIDKKTYIYTQYSIYPTKKSILYMWILGILLVCDVLILSHSYLTIPFTIFPASRQRQEFDALEFFAGRANLSRYLKMSGYRTGSLDILYRVEGKKKKEGKGCKTNPMNLLSASGFAFLAYLEGRADLKIFGIYTTCSVSTCLSLIYCT